MFILFHPMLHAFARHVCRYIPGTSQCGTDLSDLSHFSDPFLDRFVMRHDFIQSMRP